MTMTTHQGPGTAVSTFTSPATISAVNGVLTASNLVGRNPANPGVNRVPAVQTGAATSTVGPIIAAPQQGPVTATLPH
jgi:hypothetical protein